MNLPLSLSMNREPKKKDWPLRECYDDTKTCEFRSEALHRFGIAQELKVFDDGLLKVFIDKQVSLFLFDSVDVCLDVTNMVIVRKHD